ncbi:MAG TPA: carboxypeptidase-like regulatory domain-containing protein [Bryobacteraceae bacterium]|nr:carboxypeptidase-like regulatory domain-containing protein [Bryobacteraceae bacterium]
MKNRTAFLVGLAALILFAANLSAQLTSATLTGVVSDPSGAVVPQAKVRLVNEKTGDARETVTNNDGYYTFAGMAVGDLTYKLIVEAKGFVTFEAPGISLLNGEKRNVNVTLKVGNTSETVEVMGVADSIVPVDSGEKSETLTTSELQNYVQVGSNAAEYIKIMPGFAVQNGTNNASNYTGETIGINGNGAAGSQSPLNNAYSYDGLPSNSLDITADGAHVSDPGCNCDTPVNPNSDMISEFKVMSGNFSAENQKGPIVISSIAKSGGSEFHGSGFFYARDYAMNANDWIFNKDGVTRPQDKYFYPGGTIGGPVLIPGTNFNKNRNKLFFFTGFEYYYQVLNTSLVRATVPTPSEMTGDFSPQSIATEGAITASGGPPGALNALGTAAFPGGQIPASMIDPNMVALMKLYPQPNNDPAVTGGYNYVASPTFNQNNTQWMSRVDYSISDNTKLFVRYNLQRETQPFPVGLWWTQDDQVPYPTNVLGKNKSDSVSASLTHVFSPSMTNEFVFGYTYIGFPNVFQDPSKVDRSTVGYNYSEIYKNGVTQIPSFGGLGWANQEAALVFNPAGFELGGPSAGLYADKWMPNVSDTITKVVGTHTLKAGFFWEWIRNAQPNNPNANGYLEIWSGGGSPSTWGNEYADLITGNLSYGYNETSFTNLNDESYNTYEGFVQDDWKVSKRLTLNYGIRLTHFQNWIDRVGNGFPVFIPSDYSASASPLSYSGWEWHKIDPSIPLGGFGTRPLFYAPRVGAAYDLTGSGKTVLRGGWGRYYFHSSQFTTGLPVSAGVASTTLQTQNLNIAHLYASQLDNINFASSPLSPDGLNPNDDKEPYTDSWNFTISRRTPWSSLLEVSYVGNRSRDLLNNASGAGTDINLVPVGSMLSSKNGGQDPNKLNAQNFVPYSQYNNGTYLATNNLYANYNALQVTWVRSKGRYNINLNYAFGKAMGIVNANLDPYNLANDYGVVPANRTHIFNAAYSIELPNPTHDKILGGFVNGWQLSGITQIESGANLTGNSTADSFNFGDSANVAGATFAASNTSLLGTNQIQLTPLLTCNPASNLAPHQFINSSCFAQPTQIGQNGPSILPAIYGPWFFNSDLGLFKNFQITESKKLQFRVDGYNFLNHPLWSFYGGENLSLALNAAGAVTSPLFGYTTDKQGHRIVQLAVKFYF